MPISVACIRDEIVSAIFTFKAPRLIRVRSVKIGLLFRIAQVVIVGMIAFMMLQFKLYQKLDPAQGAVFTKVKGVADTRHRTDLEPEYRRIWDVADYVIPPMEVDNVFIMTHVQLTANQTLSLCAENPDYAPCNTSAQCEANTSSPVGNGVMTGNCIFYGNDTNGEPLNSCEIEGWCPTEKRPKDLPNWTNRPMFPEAVNFTIFAKNHIEFEEYSVKTSNVLPGMAKYIKTCRYHEKTDPYCPRLQLGYVIQKAGITNVTHFLRHGGIIRIVITWDCNLDHGISACKPIYHFGRLDIESAANKGWNFRYGHYYRRSGDILYRDLVKAYGTLIVFDIHGDGGKFNFIRAMLTLGSIAAIFGAATIVCDFLFSYVFKVRARYQKRKYADLFEDDIKILLEKVEAKQVVGDKVSPETSSFRSPDIFSPDAAIVKANTTEPCKTKSAAEVSKVGSVATAISKTLPVATDISKIKSSAKRSKRK